MLLFAEKIQLRAELDGRRRAATRNGLRKDETGLKEEEKERPRAQPEIFNRSGIHYFRESRSLLSISLRPPCREFDTTEPMLSQNARGLKKSINEKKRDEQKEKAGEREEE